MRLYIFTSLLFLFSPCVIANNYLHISANLTNFDYQEYLSNGENFNKETGSINGLSAGYSYIANNVGFNLKAAYNAGNVDYLGKTQAGVELNTTTKEHFTEIGAELIWYPVSFNLGLYAKFQWFEWQRNILPSSQSIALNEVYKWQNFGVGFVMPIFQYNKHEIELQLGLSHSTNGHLEVNLSDIGFGKPKLDLGEGSEISTSLTYHLKLTNDTRLSIGLTHRQWEFSQSNSKVVSSNTNSIIIREPRSKTKTTSLFISYRFNLNLFSKT
jgi:hypothetical protein